MRPFLLLCVLALAGCPQDNPTTIEPTDTPDLAGSDSGEQDATSMDEPDMEETPADCTPSETQYDAVIGGMLGEYCGECHAADPQFGAPYSLVDGYADLIAGPEGERKTDRILSTLLAGAMPPAFSRSLPHANLDTLVGWASCGLEHADPSQDLVANRPVWDAPDTPPANVTSVDLTADEESVAPDVLDDYRSFTFANVVTEDRFVRRIEPIVDDSRVLHHITLTTGTALDPTYWYAWAPGTGAIEFPDGGMRITPNDRLIVEIHYNNGAGVQDAVDSSGVRLFLADTVGTEYGMMSPTTFAISVRPGETAVAEKLCTATMDFDIIAGMPHMHQIGSTFSHDVIRADGTVENLITLSGWNFEAQYFYEMPVRVNAGDQLRLVCGYENTRDFLVTGGPGTNDEMCFNFAVVVPAEAAAECGGFF